MTSMLRYGNSKRDDAEERKKLLQDDSCEVSFHGTKSTKKRNKLERKLSDSDSSCQIPLVDVGSIPTAPPTDQCVEAEVQPGDTLASLALKYNVPTSELKRVNNILSENTIFALKRIRIPVKPASLLTEILPASYEANGETKLQNGWFVKEMQSPLQTGGTSSTVASSHPSEVEQDNLHLGEHEIPSSSHRDQSSGNKSSKKARRFLRNVDKDVARIKERLDVDEDSDLDDNEDENGRRSTAFSSMSSAVKIHSDSVSEDEPNNNAKLVAGQSGSGQFCSRSKLACCIFFAAIVFVLVVILVLAHHEYDILSEQHRQHVHHHHQTNSST